MEAMTDDDARFMRLAAYSLAWGSLWTVCLHSIPVGRTGKDHVIALNAAHGLVSTTAACLTIYHGWDTTTSVSASLSYFVVDVIAMFYADGLRNLHRLNRSRIMDYAHHFLGMFWGYIYFSHEATVCQPSLGNPYVWIQTNEVSTAFYNWFRMTNNTIAGALFVVTFFLSRIVFNTFYLIPRLINECQTFPYLWGCMPFFALQYLWFSMIINKMKNVRPAPQDMDSITQCDDAPSERDKKTA